MYNSSKCLQRVSHEPSDNMSEIGTHTGTIFPTDEMTGHKRVKLVAQHFRAGQRKSQTLVLLLAIVHISERKHFIYH